MPCNMAESPRGSRKMSRTLLVPDVHEQYHRLLNIEEVFMATADRVVMLGDFFDTFDPEKYPTEVARWVKAHLDDPKFDILLGNHDASYAFKGPWRCSGWTEKSQAIISAELTQVEWRKFKGFTRVGEYLVSHAGFHPKTIDLANEDVAKMAIETALLGEWSRFWEVGYCRGGRKPVGGPVWLDWNEEFVPMERAQIVGHTYQRGAVRSKVWNPPDTPHKDWTDPSDVTSYCIDSGLNHVMWHDDETGKIEIVPLDWGEASNGD